MRVRWSIMPQKDIADILYNYGDERASRRIARAIVKARTQAPITRTLQLADIIRSVMPRPKPGQSDSAARSKPCGFISIRGCRN